MTSEERREARYQRRVAQRRARRNARYANHDDFSTVFSFGHLYRSYQRCRRGVGWKASVQKYITNAPLNVFNTYKELENGKFKSPGFFEFDLYERGKHRHIRSTGIMERVVQRCLCDNALVPMVERSFIYDNGASMKNKGYDFSVRRLTKHLQEHFRRYGTDGYILLFDFSKFFDNVSHELIKTDLHRRFTDQKILALTEHFIDAFGEKGMGLGSQISQVLALASANKLDHFMKDICRIKGYGRYMDDGYIIYHNKEFLVALMQHLKDICTDLGITLNEKKTQIVKLSHGFTWLKIRFFLTKTGRVVKKIYKRSVTRMRRKLKKLCPKLNTGKLTFSDIWITWQSWKAYAQKFDAWHTIQNMGKLYKQLYIDDWLRTAE